MAAGDDVHSPATPGTSLTLTDCLRRLQIACVIPEGCSGAVESLLVGLESIVENCFCKISQLALVTPLLQQEWPFAAKFLPVFVKLLFFLCGTNVRQVERENIGKRGFCTFLRPKRAVFDESLPFKVRHFRRNEHGNNMLCSDNQPVALNICRLAFQRFSRGYLGVHIHLLIILYI